MKTVLYRAVKVGETTYELQLPRCYDAAEAYLEDALLEGAPPTSLSVLQKDGVDEIRYRWEVQGFWVTLTTQRYQVVTRHLHRRRFMVARNPDLSGAYPTTDSSATVSVQPHKARLAKSVWLQQRDELSASISRLNELHAQVEKWLQAAKERV